MPLDDAFQLALVATTTGFSAVVVWCCWYSSSICCCSRYRRSRRAPNRIVENTQRSASEPNERGHGMRKRSPQMTVTDQGAHLVECFRFTFLMDEKAAPFCLFSGTLQ